MYVNARTWPCFFALLLFVSSNEGSNDKAWTASINTDDGVSEELKELTFN